MAFRVEFDLASGESRQIETEAYVVDGGVVLIDAGTPVPSGAVLASTMPMPEVVEEPPQLTQQQLAKLMAFLKANPDILAAAQL